MKRSEMLEKMVFSMELHAGNDPAWLDYMPGMKAAALDYADKILRDLEEAGMLPPASCEFLSQNTYSLTDAILDSVSQDFKWDQEDEKK